MDIFSIPNEIVVLIISFYEGSMIDLAGINMKFRRRFAQNLFDLMRIDYGNIDHFTETYGIVVRHVIYSSYFGKSKYHDYETAIISCEKNYKRVIAAKNIIEINFSTACIDVIDCGELPKSIKEITCPHGELADADKLPNLEYIDAGGVIRKLPKTLKSIECSGEINMADLVEMKNLRKLILPNYKLTTDLSGLNIEELQIAAEDHFEYLPQSCEVLDLKIKTDAPRIVQIDNLPPNLQALVLITTKHESIWVNSLPPSLVTLDISRCIESNVQIGQEIVLPSLKVIYANLDSYTDLICSNLVKFPNIEVVNLVSGHSTIQLRGNGFIQNNIGAFDMRLVY